MKVCQIQCWFCCSKIEPAQKFWGTTWAERGGFFFRLPHSSYVHIHGTDQSFFLSTNGRDAKDGLSCSGSYLLHNKNNDNHPPLYKLASPINLGLFWLWRGKTKDIQSFDLAVPDFEGYILPLRRVTNVEQDLIGFYENARCENKKASGLSCVRLSLMATLTWQA